VVSPSTDPGPPSSRRPRRLSRGAMVSLGLLLTLVGLFVLGGTIPSAPGPLERALAVTGFGVATLLIGGIILGRSGGR
jgi:hypothetical protein